MILLLYWGIHGFFRFFLLVLVVSHYLCGDDDSKRDNKLHGVVAQ